MAKKAFMVLLFVGHSQAMEPHNHIKEDYVTPAIFLISTGSTVTAPIAQSLSILFPPKFGTLSFALNMGSLTCLLAPATGKKPASDFLNTGTLISHIMSAGFSGLSYAIPRNTCLKAISLATSLYPLAAGSYALKRSYDSVRSLQNLRRK